MIPYEPHQGLSMILDSSETSWIIELCLSGQALSERPSLHLCSRDCGWWGWERQRWHCEKGQFLVSLWVIPGPHVRDHDWLHKTWWPQWCGKHMWQRIWLSPGVSRCLIYRQRCKHSMPGWVGSKAGSETKIKFNWSLRDVSAQVQLQVFKH